MTAKFVLAMTLASLVLFVAKAGADAPETTRVEIIDAYDRDDLDMPHCGQRCYVTMEKFHKSDDQAVQTAAYSGFVENGDPGSSAELIEAGEVVKPSDMDSDPASDQGDFMDDCDCSCEEPSKPCLPSTIHAPGNMMLHKPYIARPKTYYYFRPYNYMHIRHDQRESSQWGADPRLPYSNEIFAKVYEQFE